MPPPEQLVSQLDGQSAERRRTPAVEHWWHEVLAPSADARNCVSYHRASISGHASDAGGGISSVCYRGDHESGFVDVLDLRPLRSRFCSVILRERLLPLGCASLLVCSFDGD